MMRTQNEIIKQGYDALINSLGVTDTIRFIQYFSPSKGDYISYRHQWLVPQGVRQKSLIQKSKVLWNMLFRDFKWLLYLRRDVLDKKTLVEVLVEMKQLQSDDTNQYDEVIE